MRTLIINNRMLAKDKHRMEGKYYLNDSSYLSLILEKNRSGCTPLGELAEVMNPPVFKRQFCKNTTRAVPYYQSSSITLSEESSDVYVYRQQAESLDAIVHEGDILVTGFGTIGNVRIVSKFQDGACYANNVARVRPKEPSHRGYIYAVLSSKYGKAQLNKNASGSVVRYIEAPGMRQTLIPNLTKEFTSRIDGLVRESIQYREESTNKLNEAKQSLLNFIDLPFSRKLGFKTAIKSSKDITDSFKLRFDPPVHVFDSVSIFNSIRNKCVTLGECNVKIWYPGMFKRIYVDNGLPYIQGSSIFETNPFKDCDYLSRSKTPKLSDLWLTNGLLLISCAGICGQVKLITKEYEDRHSIGSPDIIRLQSNDPLFSTGYLFTYLQLPIVYDYMQSLKYGSVIERFDVQNVATIPVVKPTQEISDQISSIIDQYSKLVYSSFCKEQEAISMVENEIEKWKRN